MEKLTCGELKETVCFFVRKPNSEGGTKANLTCNALLQAHIEKHSNLIRHQLKKIMNHTLKGKTLSQGLLQYFFQKTGNIFEPIGCKLQKVPTAKY